jgi:hypothetical protein
MFFRFTMIARLAAPFQVQARRVKSPSPSVPLAPSCRQQINFLNKRF